MFMLTFVLYKCFYCTVINSYMGNTSCRFVFTRQKQYLCLCHNQIHTSIHAPQSRHTTHARAHTITRAHAHTQAATVTPGVTRRLYVRLRVWKILDIWSMTGPVSGSFIHWVLFRGFSSMSSNAAHKHKSQC